MGPLEAVEESAFRAIDKAIRQAQLALDVTQLRERFAADDFARLSGVIAVRRQQPGAEQ